MTIDTNALLVILFGTLIFIRTLNAPTQRITGIVMIVLGLLLSIGSLVISLR